MKITEKQLLIMFDVLKESLKFIGGFAGYSEEDLIRLTNVILEQQSDKLIDVKDTDTANPQTIG